MFSFIEWNPEGRNPESNTSVDSNTRGEIAKRTNNKKCYQLTKLRRCSPSKKK